MTSDAHSRMLHIEFSFIILIQYYFMLHTNVMQIYHIINRKKYTNSTLKIMIFFSHFVPFLFLDSAGAMSPFLHVPGVH